MILVPYSVGWLKPETQEAIYRFYPNAHFESVKGDTGYADILKYYWALAFGKRVSLVVIEHDIVIHDRVRSTFDSCDCDWCGFPYDCYGAVDVYLGCTKFSTNLIQQAPSAVMIANRLYNYPRYPRGHWSVVDSRLHTVLRSYGYKKNRHVPEVTHLHDY